jgi:hypothetical protein
VGGRHHPLLGGRETFFVVGVGVYWFGCGCGTACPEHHCLLHLTHTFTSSLVGSRHLGLVGGRAIFFVVGVGVCVVMGVLVLAMFAPVVCALVFWESQNIVLIGSRHGTLLGGRHHPLLGGQKDLLCCWCGCVLAWV